MNERGAPTAAQPDGTDPTFPADEYDVVIVGAGPAGMAAALYTGRARLRTVLVDRMGAGGGQLLNTELIEDYPGFRSVTGEALARAAPGWQLPLPFPQSITCDAHLRRLAGQRPCRTRRW